MFLIIRCLSCQSADYQKDPPPECMPCDFLFFRIQFRKRNIFIRNIGQIGIVILVHNRKRYLLIRNRNQSICSVCSIRSVRDRCCQGRCRGRRYCGRNRCRIVRCRRRVRCRIIVCRCIRRCIIVCRRIWRRIIIIGIRCSRIGHALTCTCGFTGTRRCRCTC